MEAEIEMMEQQNEQENRNRLQMLNLNRGATVIREGYSVKNIRMSDVEDAYE